MSFVLRVHDGDQTFQYSADQISDKEASYLEESDSQVIEAGSIDLRVTNSTFLGYNSYFDIPPGQYRCEVIFLFDDDLGTQRILNGRINRDGVTQIESMNVWVVQCVNDAVDNFFEQIEATPVPNNGSSIDMDTSVVDSGGGVTTKTSRWYDIEDMWTELIGDVGGVFVSYQEVRQFFHLDITYDDSGTDRIISRKTPLHISSEEGILQLPDWNGGQLFDVLKDLLGWRVTAEYAPYPDTTILVTILTDQFPIPLNQATAIDTLEEEAGRFEITGISAQIEDFGIVYSNGVDEEPSHASLTVPQSLAVYSAPRSEIGSDGKPTNRGLRTIKLHLPELDTSGTESSVTPDAANHPNYQEDINWAIPAVQESDRVYICAIQDITAIGNRMVASRAPLSPATSQLGQTAEYWAIEIFNNFVLSISSLFQVSGLIDFSAIADEVTRPVVGNPIFGVRFKDTHWMLSKVDWLLDDNTAEIIIHRLENTPEIVLDLPLVCPPKPITIVQTLFADLPQFTLDWNPPDPGCGQQLPASYDISLKKPGETVFTFVTNVTATTYNTGIINPGGFGTYVWCIQSKTAGGALSDCRFGSIENVDSGGSV